MRGIRTVRLPPHQIQKKELNLLRPTCTLRSKRMYSLNGVKMRDHHRCLLQQVLLRAFSSDSANSTEWEDTNGLSSKSKPLNGSSTTTDTIASITTNNAFSKIGQVLNASEIEEQLLEQQKAHAVATIAVDSRGITITNPEEEIDDPDSYKDYDFLANRMGFQIFDPNTLSSVDAALREETRKEAIRKTELMLNIMRNSMTELEISHVIKRAGQYSTLPRLSKRSKINFFHALKGRFGSKYQKEYEYFVAYLEGKDDFFQDITLPLTSTSSSFSHTIAAGPYHERITDPQFLSIVLYYCRLACLNSFKLFRKRTTNLEGTISTKKASLSQVKSDFRKVLETENLTQFAEMIGLDGTLVQSSHSLMNDPEWEQFNLENDLIDFRTFTKQAHEIVEILKVNANDTIITNMIMSMLASVKTTKLHRKIFQEMVCEIQTVLPIETHEKFLSKLVSFLSGNNATYEDFQTEFAESALQHHRLRHEAILRALLDCRMRVSHILVHDLDDANEMDTIAHTLTCEQRERVITTAWNIVSLLSDQQYHAFFARFIKYKLAWRPNRKTFTSHFLSEVRQSIGKENEDVLMPLIEKCYMDLSVETLTICRVKLHHLRRQFRQKAQLISQTKDSQSLLENIWPQDRTVFYTNLPEEVDEQHLRETLENIGPIKKVFFFSDPMTQSIEKAQEEIEKEIEIEKQIQIQIQKEKEIEIEEIEIEEEEEEEEVDFHLLDEEEECSGGEENDESPTEEEIIETIANKNNKKIKKKKKATTKKNQKKKTTTQQKQRRKKYKDIVIASDKPTKNCVAIEFETCSSKKRALQHALQIFGIMVEGETERRPVFSTDVDKHCVISIQKIPFRTPIGEVLSTIRRILHAKGFEIELPQTLPDGVFVTTGKIELCFQEYAQAAVVLQLLNENVQPFQPRTTHTQKCTGENDKETVENLPFRPFEVTWNPPPKSRNKHLYV